MGIPSRGWWIAWALASACHFDPGAGPPNMGVSDAPRDAIMDAPRQPPRDTPRDATACTAILLGSGQLNAPDVTTPPSIDGDLSDWTTCFVTLDDANAALVENGGSETQFPTALFALEHDAGHVYFGAQVKGIAPLGSGPLPDIYLNNAIELYIAGNGMITAPGYPSDTLQIVIDHANRVQAFTVGAAVVSTGITSAATLGSDGVTYTIEASVVPGTFGLSNFGSAIGFDLAIDDGSGTSQLSSQIWYEGCGSSACPGSTCEQPFCDEREFGTAMLAP